MTAIEQFPHCDTKVLHAPGECQYCDRHPDWQELRERWGINFTGTYVEGFALCPSQQQRPIDVVHRWGGNRPTNPQNFLHELDEPEMDRVEQSKKKWWRR